MRITSKGQVTIPQAIRDKAGLQPLSEVEFELRSNGEVLIKPISSSQSSLRMALQKVRGSANSAQFKSMGTDEFMQFLRG